VRQLRSLGRFVYEFVVGDDWTIALGVVGTLGLTAVIAELGAAWFVTPIGVVALLGLSVWRAARST
jgi:hypothetical protein